MILENKDIIELHIEEFSAKGRGVAYIKNVEHNFSSKVEIPHVLPQDVVLAKTKKKRKGLIKGRLEKIIKPSPMRCQPMCTHTEICGGCSWQQMQYECQIRQKEKTVLECFQEPITTMNVEYFPIIPAKDIWHYRNKMEFSFSENRAETKFLGLMIADAKMYVFNVEKCFLASLWVSDVLSCVKKWWENSSLHAYNGVKDIGSLRNLIVREGKNTGEKMVVLVVSGNEEYILSDNDKATFLGAVKEGVDSKQHEKLSVFLRVQKIQKKHPTIFYDQLIYGKEHIQEKIICKDILPRPLTFKISPSSFFQPNTFQAEKLFEIIFSMLDLSSKKLNCAYDFYCGTGSFGMFLAHFSEKVIGIELNEDAVRDAKENISENMIDNFCVYQGDVGEVLQKLLQEKSHQDPDVVVVDPPRAGLSLLALEQLRILYAKKIVYVSCNPKTQAEDIKVLMSYGYHLKQIVPLDQFPHTVHIENVALLSLE